MADTPIPEQVLPLGGRYQAAWSEQCARISLRQGVVQIYLTTAAILFGFWVNAHSGDPTKVTNFPSERVDELLTGGITALTVFSAALVIMHNQIIKKLTEFMARCEWHAQDSIWQHGANSKDLFNFCEPGEKSGHDLPRAKFVPRDHVRRSHRIHRVWHRVLIALIIAATSFASVRLTWKIETYSWVCACVSALFVLALFAEIAKDVIEAMGD